MASPVRSFQRHNKGTENYNAKRELMLLCREMTFFLTLFYGWRHLHLFLDRNAQALSLSL